MNLWVGLAVFLGFFVGFPVFISAVYYFQPDHKPDTYDDCG